MKFWALRAAAQKRKSERSAVSNRSSVPGGVRPGAGHPAAARRRAGTNQHERRPPLGVAEDEVKRRGPTRGNTDDGGAPSGASSRQAWASACATTPASAGNGVPRYPNRDTATTRSPSEQRGSAETRALVEPPPAPWTTSTIVP